MGEAQREVDRSVEVGVLARGARHLEVLRDDSHEFARGIVAASVHQLEQHLRARPSRWSGLDPSRRRREPGEFGEFSQRRSPLVAGESDATWRRLSAVEIRTLAVADPNRAFQRQERFPDRARGAEAGDGSAAIRQTVQCVDAAEVQRVGQVVGQRVESREPLAGEPCRRVRWLVEINAVALEEGRTQVWSESAAAVWSPALTSALKSR